MRRAARCSAIALLLAGAAFPCQAAATAAAAAAAQPADPNQPIVITAPTIFSDVQPERTLDREAINGYGLSTIDELLSELQVELGSDEDFPLIIVNGERLNSIDEIGALPVEVLRSLVVLPRGSAVRAGGTANQRVLSLTLRPKVQSATLTAATKIATQGDWHSERGEVILTSVRGFTRVNIALRGRTDSNLFESDRGIVQPAPRIPYALVGNVVGFPNSLGEIDPALSLAARQIVTVVPVPAIANPTLADFIAGANQPLVTDLGDYRSLRPKSRNYDLNGTFATRLTPWLTSSATVRLNRSTSLYLRGLPAATFILSSDNPASPFTRDVGVAVYGANPLRSRSIHDSGEGNLTLDADFGAWTANLNARHNRTRDVSTSERATAFGPIPLDDSLDPFGADLTDLIDIRSDRATAKTTDTLLDLTLNGPLFALPAGNFLAVVEGQLEWNRLFSTSTYSIIDPKGDFRRNEQSLRASFDIPLASRDKHFLAAIGDFRAQAEIGRIHYSDAGTLDHQAFGLTWDPRPLLQLRASIDRTETPAPIQTLGNPVVVTPAVRIFDPLTETTVDVSQVTGGNPSALPQTATVRRLSAQFKLVPKWNFQLNIDYTDTDRRDFLSSLPDSSAAIMLAFPERFIRDSNGVLTRVDLRPVNFDSEREQRLRLGFNMNARLDRQAPPPPPSTPGAAVAPRQPPRPATYLQLNANYIRVLSDRIVIRPGLPPVDLINGGALGIGGGRVRNQADGSASLSSGGLGARAGFTWRSSSSLLTRLTSGTDTLRFDPQLLVNLRLFAEGGRVVPNIAWAKKLRLSLDVINLFDSRQRVRDSLGDTPLQYQSAYRDPIGRTVEIELRAVF